VEETRSPRLPLHRGIPWQGCCYRYKAASRLERSIVGFHHRRGLRERKGARFQRVDWRSPDGRDRTAGASVRGESADEGTFRISNSRLPRSRRRIGKRPNCVLASRQTNLPSVPHGLLIGRRLSRLRLALSLSPSGYSTDSVKACAVSL